MKKSPPLNIIYFGIYSKDVEYPRNNNLIRGLRLHGVNVIEAHSSIAGSFQQRMRIAQNPLEAFLFIFKLAASYVILTWKFVRAPQTNAVIIGHPGYFHFPLALLLRFIFKKKALLVYDVFIPLYNAIVEDRMLIRPGSLIARFLHRFETFCCQRADLCLIDTMAHCKYLVSEFNLSPKRVRRIFVGPTINDTFDSPADRSGHTFKVLYVGTYIPLHGVDVILRAAQELSSFPDIQFILAGSGQLQKVMERLVRYWKLDNIIFKDWIPTDRLGQYIRSCDLSLGIFGCTSKAQRVIPSKVFDICTAGVPFITADTPAVREAFHHGENAWLVQYNNPQALAEAILKLKSDSCLRKRIAKAAQQTGKKRFSLQQIGNDLIQALLEANSPS